MGGGSATSRPRILGLTGPIASGKTTVGDILLDLGVPCRIDADQVVHDLMRAGTSVTNRVVERFGSGMTRADGEVDRSKLGSLVFGDKQALRDLESIIHPEVREVIRQRVAQQASDAAVVIDAVKLLQSDLVELCDAIWVVQADERSQLRRLREDRGLNEEEAEARLRAQPTFNDSRVSTVIDNSGSREELVDKVTRAWQKLAREWQLLPA